MALSVFLCGSCGSSPLGLIGTNEQGPLAFERAPGEACTAQYRKRASAQSSTAWDGPAEGATEINIDFTEAKTTHLNGTKEGAKISQLYWENCIIGPTESTVEEEVGGGRRRRR